MASEYTENYQLDLYASQDKPNLRDQYNAAMTKVDTALHEQAVSIGNDQTAIAQLRTDLTAETAARVTGVNEAKQAAANAQTDANNANQLAMSVNEDLQKTQNAVSATAEGRATGESFVGVTIFNPSIATHAVGNPTKNTGKIGFVFVEFESSAANPSTTVNVDLTNALQSLGLVGVLTLSDASYPVYDPSATLVGCFTVAARQLSYKPKSSYVGSAHAFVPVLFM